MGDAPMKTSHLNKILHAFFVIVILSISFSLFTPVIPVLSEEDPFPQLDIDSDAITNVMETTGWYNLAGGPFQTDPEDQDSDDDGLTDGEENLFNTNPIDAHSPGIAVRYESSFMTKEYFSTSDPNYLQLIQGGDQYLLAEALVVRRGTTFNIAGPASGTLTITWTGSMTTLSPVKNPVRGGWDISIPSAGTTGTYTATITDGGWSKSMPLYVIFELPIDDPNNDDDLPQEDINAFLYDDDPANKKDEVSVFFRMGWWPYYGNNQSTPQPCPETDPNTPCSSWQYHYGFGYAQAYWTEQFTKANLVNHAIQAIHGQTNLRDATIAIANWTNREFRTRSGRMQNSFSTSMYRWFDGTGFTMSGGYCETTATTFSAILRSAGIPSRVFQQDYSHVPDHHGEGGLGAGSPYEYDFGTMMWFNSTWNAQRAYTGEESGTLYYPWDRNGGVGPNVLLKDMVSHYGWYGDYSGDVIVSANAGWDFQNGSNAGGMVNTVWSNGVPPEEFVPNNRDYMWNSKSPLRITQSPYVDVLACQLWQGDSWAPSEWRTPVESNPAGRDERLTYILPIDVPN